MSEIMDVDDRFSEEEDTLDAILWAIHSGRLPRAEPNEAGQDTARELLIHYENLIYDRVAEELIAVMNDWAIPAAMKQLGVDEPYETEVYLKPRVTSPIQGEVAPGPPGDADAYVHERRQLPSVDG